MSRETSPFLDPFRLERDFYMALARAFGGAMLFGLPLFMTMEMWRVGFTIPPMRLALFVLVGFVGLWPLAWLAGFRDDVSPRDALIDAGVAYLVGTLASTLVLLLLAVLGPGMSVYEIVGKIAVQSVPTSMGAVLARGTLGLKEEQKQAEHRRQFYPGELYLMGTGALFLAFNIAPTEEILAIALGQASPWYLLAVMLVSIGLMHAFVYAVGFKGQHSPGTGKSGLVEFATLTLPGYVTVLVVCLLALWIFGRLDGTSPGQIRDLVLVLSFPGALGAAAARLIL